MSHEGQNRVIACVGRPHTGKSTWLDEHLRYCPRLVVFDVLDEYDSIPNRIESLRRLEQFLKWTRDQENFACRYFPSGTPKDEIEGVADLVYKRGDLCLVCEELALYTEPGSCPPLLDKLARTARHREIDFCWATQRPGETAKAITAVTRLWVLFHLAEPRDLDRVAEQCGREIADHVARLGEHEHIIWDVASRQIVEDSLRLLKR